MSFLGSEFNFQFDGNVCVDPAALCDSIQSLGPDLVPPKDPGEELKTQLEKRRPRKGRRESGSFVTWSPGRGRLQKGEPLRPLGGGASWGRGLCKARAGTQGVTGSVGRSPAGAGASVKFTT